MALAVIRRKSDKYILGKVKEPGQMYSTMTGYISGCEYDEWLPEDEISTTLDYKLGIYQTEEGALNRIIKDFNTEDYEVVKLFDLPK